MQKRWVESVVTDPAMVKNIQDLLNIDEVLAALLVNRGYTSFESTRDFFRPSLSQLHDPFLMKDMDKAISRIERALTNKEKILIFGDYDVDGTTAVALTYRFFKSFYHSIEYYIPDRYKEGYGISRESIDYAQSKGITLIIALDCGIKSNDKIAYASELGIDFIICDHHLPGDTIPKATAVLDPKQNDCPYPYKELSGCGIGFKLIQAFAAKNNYPQEDVNCYLDLVAVSIASDIVPITGENRILAHFGLRRLNENPCHGLFALMQLSGKKNFGITEIIFSIGPRINAAGRMDDGRQAVSLLISPTCDCAQLKCKEIDLHNQVRKEFDSQITEEALAMIEADVTSRNRKTTVVYNESWHKGVIGIVASRLTERYYRPTIVLTRSNGHIAGSARSVIGYDIYGALNNCSDLLEQFGGHKYAAGLLLKPENVPALQERFEDIVANSISDALLVQEINIDAALDLDKINGKFFRILKQFSPFGPLNETPVFISKNLNICTPAQVVGNKHLKLSVKDSNSREFDCIAFGMGEYADLVNNGTAVDICYTIEENEWKDRKNVQLNIKGIRPSIK